MILFLSTEEEGLEKQAHVHKQGSLEKLIRQNDVLNCIVLFCSDSRKKGVVFIVKTDDIYMSIHTFKCANVFVVFPFLTSIQG